MRMLHGTGMALATLPPEIGESMLVESLLATATPREETLGRDASLQQRDSRGPAGVCR